MLDTAIQGDALTVLKTLPSEYVDCCITSPPYWGLRNYGVSGQLGLEKTPELYVSSLVEIFREVKRVLKKDGTCWVNLGDTYAGNVGGNRNGMNNTTWAHAESEKQRSDAIGSCAMRPKPAEYGLKPKDLVGIPWMVAFALRADGWYLRQDIIWAKPNPMPESVKDRCTKSHEYVFLLAKSQRYYFDNEAIKEPIKDTSAARLMQDIENQNGSNRVPGKTNGNMKAVKFGGNKQCTDNRLRSGKEWNPQMAGGGSSYTNGHSGYFDAEGNPLCGLLANKRDVWTIPTHSFKEAHFAVFPEALIEPMIKAGCPEGGIVLDPFFGSGTTGRVSIRLNRHYIGIDLNTDYIDMAGRRTDNVQRVLAGMSNVV